MECSQATGREVVEPVERVDDLAAAGAGQGERNRVHGEVTAREILFDRRTRRHRRQRARSRVAFRAQQGEVDVLVIDGNRGSAERREMPYVTADETSYSFREWGWSPIDRDVHILYGESHVGIANRPSDQPDRALLFGGYSDRRVEQSARDRGERATYIGDVRALRRMSGS